MHENGGKAIYIGSFSRRGPRSFLVRKDETASGKRLCLFPSLTFPLWNLMRMKEWDEFVLETPINGKVRCVRR